MLIDESFGADPDAHRLTRLYHTDGRLVRVTVHRDFYPQQSWAAVRVLTPVLTWTELLSAPASDWHPSTPPSRRATADTLAPVADRLLSRATASCPPTPPPAHRTHPPAPDPPGGRTG